jgi:hypothetical protein
LQSQLAKTARKRLSLSGLEVLHGRLVRRNPANAITLFQFITGSNPTMFMGDYTE